MKRSNISRCGSSLPAKKMSGGECSSTTGEHVFEYFFHFPLLIQFLIVREYIPWLHKILTLSQIDKFAHLLDSAHAWSSPLQAKLNRSVQALRLGLYVNNYMSAKGFAVFADYDSLCFVACDLADLNCKIQTSSNGVLILDTGISSVDGFLDYFMHMYSWVEPDAELYKVGYFEYIVVDRVAGFVRWREGTVPLSSVVVLNNTCLLDISSSEVKVHSCLRHNHEGSDLCDFCNPFVKRLDRNCMDNVAKRRDFRMRVLSTSAESARIVVQYNKLYRSSHDKLREWGEFFPDMLKEWEKRKSLNKKIE